MSVIFATKWSEICWRPHENKLSPSAHGGSQLALWQAEYVRKRLNRLFPDLGVELQIIKTTGDAIQERSLAGLGKGCLQRRLRLRFWAAE